MVDQEVSHPFLDISHNDYISYLAPVDNSSHCSICFGSLFVANVGVVSVDVLDVPYFGIG